MASILGKAGRTVAQPPSKKARDCPKGPTTGADRRTCSHARNHSASAVRANMAATANKVELCRCVTNVACELRMKQVNGSIGEGSVRRTVSLVTFRVQQHSKGLHSEHVPLEHPCLYVWPFSHRLVLFRVLSTCKQSWYGHACNLPACLIFALDAAMRSSCAFSSF